MTILTSRQFNQDTARAKREAEHGPVLITDRGQPAHVLLSYSEYRRLNGRRETLGEALAHPESADIDIPLPERKPELPRVSFED